MSNEFKRDSQPFHMKGFVSFVISWCFLAIVASGAVLYASPKGRVAHWTDWSFLGLGKEQWGAVHMVTTLLFTIMAAIHIYNNWTLLASYFKKRAERTFNLKREFGLATAIFAVILSGSLLDMPPVSLVTAWNEDIKTYWENRSTPGPYPHAEESTLTEFAQRVDVPLNTAMQALHEGGFSVASADVRLLDIARDNGVAPSALFGAIQDRLPSVKTAPGHGTMQLGRKTLADACQELNLRLPEVQAILATNGFSGHPGKTMREIAREAGLEPWQMLDIILQNQT